MSCIVLCQQKCVLSVGIMSHCVPSNEKRQRSRSNKRAEERIYIDEVARQSRFHPRLVKNTSRCAKQGLPFLHHRTSPRKGGLERVHTNKHSQWRWETPPLSFFPARFFSTSLALTCTHSQVYTEKSSLLTGVVFAHSTRRSKQTLLVRRQLSEIARRLFSPSFACSASCLYNLSKF